MASTGAGRVSARKAGLRRSDSCAWHLCGFTADVSLAQATCRVQPGKWGQAPPSRSTWHENGAARCPRRREPVTDRWTLWSRGTRAFPVPPGHVASLGRAGATPMGGSCPGDELLQPGEHVPPGIVGPGGAASLCHPDLSCQRRWGPGEGVAPPAFCAWWLVFLLGKRVSHFAPQQTQRRPPPCGRRPPALHQLPREALGLEHGAG